MYFTPRQKYVLEYYNRNYQSVVGDGLDTETRVYANFLAKRVKGKTLDFGCGPSLHFNALFMAKATSIDGIDVVPENIAFTKKKIKSFKPDKYLVINHFMHSIDKNYSLTKQIKKIDKVLLADFTKPLPKTLKAGGYDCVVSTFSLGCVKAVKQYEAAIRNIHKLLKKGGIMLVLNTNGKNRNKIIPEITYQGLDLGNENHSYLQRYAKKLGFKDIKTITRKIPKDRDAMYKYNALLLTYAKKP